MNLFDYYTANPAEGALFISGMSSLTAPVLREAQRVIDTSGTALAVDVGGGDGSLIRSLMRTNPELRGLVFDLPRVVGTARQEAERDGLADRFSVLGGDFFESVPEADLYLLKSILHDWDDSCVRILRSCRRAARPDARLLVVETVILDDKSFGPVAMMDMNMLAVAHGQERDLAEYDALFAAAGWRRTAVHQMNDPHSVVELRIAD
ncbi:methyltransferase [Micromonospora sp. WP24]|uniref:methyltransferase n=1 Tax=Micromonospora sp. WP24 TaxID=2604469 RepID=UPI001CA347A6|nr:methyltransferase [Micromonospora sp. WP24]